MLTGAVCTFDERRPQIRHVFMSFDQTTVSVHGTEELGSILVLQLCFRVGQREVRLPWSPRPWRRGTSVLHPGLHWAPAPREARPQPWHLLALPGLRPGRVLVPHREEDALIDSSDPAGEVGRADGLPQNSFPLSWKPPPKLGGTHSPVPGVAAAAKGTRNGIVLSKAVAPPAGLLGPPSR